VRRHPSLLALPVLVALVALTAPPGRTVPVAAQSTDRQTLDAVFGKTPGTRELLDRVEQAATPLGDTGRAFDAVGAVLGAVRKAAAIPATAGQWTFAGPRDGYYLDPAYSTAPASYGHSSGIVPALAVDRADPTGNTVYIGTHGGVFKTTDGGAHWTDLTLGKLPRLGIGALALDPTDSKTLYVGTGVALLTRSDDAAGTGLYVSRDGGKTFQPGRYDGHGYGVNALAVSGTAVFAATADGLYRSRDHGASWVRVPLLSNAAHTAEAPGKYANFVSDVAVQPNKPNVVTAAIGYGMGKLRLQDGSLASEGNGLYQSTDGGTSFPYLASTSQLKNLTDSSDPVGTITLAYSSAPGNGNVLYAVVGDAGKNRGACEADLPVPPVTDPVAGLPLTAAACASVLNGLYRSANGGASWDLKANYETLLAAPGSQLSILAALGIGPGYQAGYNKYLADDPTDPNRLVFGLEETYVSSSIALPGPAVFQLINKYWDTVGVLAGDSVGRTPGGIPFYGGITTTHPDQHIGAFVKTPTGSRLYAGNDGGIWSQDTGRLTTDTTCTVTRLATGMSNCDWKSLNDLPTVLPYHANMKPDGVIVAGLQDNGTVIIKDGKGINVCGGDGVQVGVTRNPDVFYCSTPGQGVQATKDGGKTFTSIYLSGDDIVGGDGLTAYAVDPTDGNHLLRAGRTVVETVDGPDTGATASQGFATVFDAGSSGVQAVDGTTYDWTASGTALSGKNAYVGFCPGIACRGVLTRIDQNKHVIATNVKAGCKNAKKSGACWHLAKARGLPFGQVAGIAIDPKHPQTVYVSMNTYNFLGLDPKQAGTAKVLVSRDAGETFRDLTGNLPYAGANNVVLIGQRLFVATEVGAFTAPAGSSSWQQLGSGLPAVPVRDLQADLSGKHLVASMYGRGVWTFATAGLGGVGPVQTPGTAKPGGTGAGRGGLPATGLPVGLALTALLLLGTGLAVRRRARS
jgi:hypothetical protein